MQSELDFARKKGAGIHGATACTDKKFFVPFQKASISSVWVWAPASERCLSVLGEYERQTHSKLGCPAYNDDELRLSYALRSIFTSTGGSSSRPRLLEPVAEQGHLAAAEERARCVFSVALFGFSRRTWFARSLHLLAVRRVVFRLKRQHFTAASPSFFLHQAPHNSSQQLHHLALLQKQNPHTADSKGSYLHHHSRRTFS